MENKVEWKIRVTEVVYLPLLAHSHVSLKIITSIVHVKHLQRYNFKELILCY